MRVGAAVEADGKEMSLVITVKDCIGAAFVVAIEGAERHGEFSQPLFTFRGPIANFLRWTSYLLRIGVMVQNCRRFSLFISSDVSL